MGSFGTTRVGNQRSYVSSKGGATSTTPTSREEGPAGGGGARLMRQA